jgi:hypothetical protein
LPNLVVREAAVGFILIAAILLFAAMVDAPLGEIANPAMSPNPAKAAWFFLGFQELLMHLHPTFATLILPALLLLCLLLLPLRQDAILPAGHWFGGIHGRKPAFWSFLAGAVFTFAAILLDEKLKTAGGNPATDVITRGVLPILCVVLVFIAGYFFLILKMKLSKAQAVMVGFVFSFTSLGCLTVVAIWLRGPGMALVFSF